MSAITEAVTEVCDAQPESSLVASRRRRKDGSEYLAYFRIGDRCGRPAITTRFVQGKTQRRCTLHIAT